MDEFDEFDTFRILDAFLVGTSSAHLVNAGHRKVVRMCHRMFLITRPVDMIMLPLGQVQRVLRGFRRRMMGYVDDTTMNVRHAEYDATMRVLVRRMTTLSRWHKNHEVRCLSERIRFDLMDLAERRNVP